MSGGASVSDATALDRRYLSGTFAELCRIASPSGRERGCAERVIAELSALDVEVAEDGAGAIVGSDCGNLLARLPGGDASGEERRSLLLCAHLDTVPLQAPVEPVLREGFWENANEGILGADNKAAVAVLLAVARRVRHGGAPVDLELLFTVAEERSLAGARAFEAARLRSDFGFVFDHASPIGEVIVASPSHFRIDATFRGAAAHAGLHPEEGRSAIVAASRAIASMRLGRIDDQTTANVGTVAGGSAINVVAERCSLTAEVRSLDEARAEALAADVVDRLHEAANRPDCDCDLDVTLARTFAGYSLAAGAAPVQVARAALTDCGHEPTMVSSGGGSDANALLAAGFPTVNVANGTERAHEPDERVSAAALEQMLDVALAIVRRSAPDAAPAR